jgi:hypothetical protein
MRSGNAEWVRTKITDWVAPKILQQCRPKSIDEEFGPIDAYLIEVRSIGGLGGSPVYIALGNTRSIDGQQIDGQMLYLLGIVHGHYDVAEERVWMNCQATAPVLKKR